MPMYPRDRLLAFLAKIANEPGPDLEPRNWLEYYLDKIAENGGGGGCECGLNIINLDEIPVYTVQDGITNRTSDIWLDDDGWYDSYKWFVSDFEVPAIILYDDATEVQISSFRVQTINNYVAENPIGTQTGCYLMSADTVYIVSPTVENGSGILFVVNPTVQYNGLV